MTGGPAAPESGNGEGPWDRDDYQWAVDRTVDVFVRRLHSLRKGQRGVIEPMPAAAMLALRKFAVERPIDELVASATRFDYQDAVQALATAALRRTPGDAAKLVITQWEAELASQRDSPGAPAETPITGSIIHDIASQRTALDIASFLWSCTRAGKHELVGRAIAEFTRLDSGRTHLDKAQLYIALRYAGLPEEADEVMRGALRALDGLESGPAQRELTRFSETFHRLSPAEQLIETWLVGQLDRADQVPFARRIIAQLLNGSPNENSELAKYVGRSLGHNDIVDVCGRLPPASATCAAIRRHAASGDDLGRLAEIVKEWHRSAALSRTTRAFLADVVARGSEAGRGPRSITELESFATALGNANADEECRRLLWYEAAVHVAGRSGAELVELLGKVAQKRDRRRAEQAIAQNLTVRLMNGSAEPDRFVQYTSVLRSTLGAHAETALYLALKELADPPDADWVPGRSAGVIAEIAVRLCAAGLQQEADDLLERCMENEQRITPADMSVIVRRLTDDGWTADDLGGLLKNTLGRWSDAGSRGRAIDALEGPGFPPGIAELVSPLR
jgi:hypothetical protein